MEDNLKERQQAGERVEARLMFFLLQFDAVTNLSIGDTKRIAEKARFIAFDEFSKMAEE